MRHGLGLLLLIGTASACGSSTKGKDGGAGTSTGTSSTTSTTTSTSTTTAVQWKASEGGNDHWYLIDRTKSDWVNAKTRAEAAHGNLVTITSEGEEEFIINTFLTGPDKLKVFWIGCSDTAEEDTFVWVTGEPFDYTNWKSGEPNGWDGETEDYCCINWNAVRGPIGEWNDSLPDGTRDYDQGANDGPYAAIFEFNQRP